MKKSLFFAAVVAALALVSCAKEPTLEVTTSYAGEEVSYEGTTLSLTVTSEHGAWTAVSDSDWVTVDPTTGEGAKAVRLIVAKNESTSARKAVVTITVKDLRQTVTINQGGHPSLDVTTTYAGEEVSYEGASIAATVTSENGSWSASSDSDWVTVSPTAGAGATSVTITVAANAAKAARSAVVTFTCADITKTVTVAQAAHPNDLIDDVTFKGGNTISWSVNGEGQYYTGIALKSSIEGYDAMMNENMPLTIIQICSGMMAGDVKTVTCPETVSYTDKACAWFFGSFGGDAIKAGETYTIFALPKAVADDNDKENYDKIVTLDFKAE